MTSSNPLKNKISNFLELYPLASLENIFQHLRGEVHSRTLSRTLMLMKSVAKIGNKSNRVYANIEKVEGNFRQAIIQIDDKGKPEEIADLYTLTNGMFYVCPLDTLHSWVTIGSDVKHNGYFKELPWYLSSMRPNGYLGRMWAKEYGKLNEGLENVHNWRDVDVIRANIAMHLDVSGNLQLNTGDAESFFQQTVKEENKLETYDLIVQTLESGQMVGSSVDGEQQKFSVKLQEADSVERLVLIKTNHGARPDIKERQADLLIMEHVSGEILRKHGYVSSQTKILKSSEFIYLESERFDRTPEGGKKGFVSLRSICSATNFMGRQSEWIEALQHLQRKDLISKEEFQKGIDLTIIGRLIDNKDMHLGNLSLWLPQDGSKAFSLAPVYDMTSMQWTPSLKGYVPELYVFDKVSEASFELTQIAKEIWQASANHPYISADWKSFAEKKVEKFEQKLRTMFQEKEEHKTLTKINKNLMP